MALTSHPEKTLEWWTILPREQINMHTFLIRWNRREWEMKLKERWENKNTRALWTWCWCTSTSENRMNWFYYKVKTEKLLLCGRRCRSSSSAITNTSRSISNHFNLARSTTAIHLSRWSILEYTRLHEWARFLSYLFHEIKLAFQQFTERDMNRKGGKKWEIFQRIYHTIQ